MHLSVRQIVSRSLDRARVASRPLVLRVRAALRWITRPARSVSDIRGAEAVGCALRDGMLERVDQAAVIEAAARLTDLGRNGTATALLDLAVEKLGRRDPLLRARRRVPGYVGVVTADTIRRAEQAVIDSTPTRRWRPRRRQVAVATGRGDGVEAVVRHRVQATGATMVRKTLSSSANREVLAYRSGLLSAGGRWWRAPRAHHIATEPDGRCHLFLEDIGRVTPLASAADMIAVARAVGELNGTHLGDSSLISTHQWLACPTGATRPLPAVEGFLADVVDVELTRRVATMLDALGEHYDALSAVNTSFPATFCHGDPTSGNVAAVGGQHVLIDWPACRIAPIGTDVAQLLQLPNQTINADRAVVGSCLGAYIEGIASNAATSPSALDVELGYRHRFVYASFRWQMDRLAADHVRRGIFGRRRIEMGTRHDAAGVVANLIRLCDEADALLAQAGLTGGRSRR